MFNTSRRRVNKNSLTWWYVLKTSLKRSLQNVLNMSWRFLEDVFARRLEDFLKTSWRQLGKRSWRCYEDVLKMFWRRLCKMSWKRLEEFWQDVLKTYDQDECIGLDQDILKTSWRLRRTYSSWSIRLLKTKTKDIFKTSSSRRMFAWKVLNVFWHKFFILKFIVSCSSFIL